jgi:hypothetical protein
MDNSRHTQAINGLFTGLKAKIKPIRAKDNRAEKERGNDKENNATACTKTATPKAKIFLQPPIDSLQGKEFQKTRQTAGTLFKIQVVAIKVDWRYWLTHKILLMFA